MKTEPVTVRELNLAKEYVVGNLRLALESPAGQMMWTGEYILNYGAVLSPEEAIAAVNAVRAEDIQKTADAVFKNKTATLAMISPGVSGQENEILNQMLATI